MTYFFFQAFFAFRCDVLLTGCGGLTDKGDELLLYFLHSIQVVNKKNVSVTGFTGNVHQFTVVCIRKADCKYDITWVEIRKDVLETIFTH